MRFTLNVSPRADNVSREKIRHINIIIIVIIKCWVLNKVVARKVVLKAFIHHPHFNTSRPRQNGRHFADDFFKYVFLYENMSIWINISLKFVPNGEINNIPALVQIMAWRQAIIWNIDGKLTEAYASFSLNELIF